jgi:hypothetical protein
VRRAADRMRLAERNLDRPAGGHSLGTRVPA